MPKKEKNKNKKAKEEIKEKEEKTFHAGLDLSEPAEESLEELAEAPEMPETDSFSEFMIPETSEMPTMTLPSSSTAVEPEENLEDSASSSIASTPINTSQQVQQDYVTIYNQPEYTAGSSEEKMIEGIRRGDRATRTAEQLRDIRPGVAFEDWHEAGESRERARGENLREYVIAEADDRKEESRKLPFEERRKYKELRR